MKRYYSILVLILIILPCSQLFSQDKSKWFPLIGSAYSENQSYNFLRKLCDEAGGRLVGSPANEKAMQILVNELGKIGCKAVLEKFNFMGWQRGDDEVSLVTPLERRLQAIALGFSDKTPEIKTEIVYLGSGLPEEYDGKDVSGKIVLVSNDAPVGKEHPLRCEAIRTAFSKGAKAVLFINDKIGMLNLAGVADFQDKPSPIPGFSLTMEEGLWLKRLLNDKESVIVNIKTESQCKPSESANIIYTLPGKSKKKIVLTAHFDSWDLSQGTVDNGYGTAILFDVCRILKNYDHNNYYTIEFAWVNGEELGLIGSGKYVEMHANDSIIANINMDMTGTPTGFNALGFDELVPFLKNIADSLKGFDFSDGVTSQPWLGSDQESFFLKGIPAITLNAYLDKDMYWWYHDAGDTFDKARKKMLSDAAAVVSVLTYELANNTSLHCPVYSEDNVIKFLKKFNLDKQLKKQMLWNFGE